MLKPISKYSTLGRLTQSSDEWNRVLSAESNHSSWSEEGSCAWAWREATAPSELPCAHHWPVKAHSTRLHIWSQCLRVMMPACRHPSSSTMGPLHILGCMNCKAQIHRILPHPGTQQEMTGIMFLKHLSASMVLSPTTSTCGYQPWKPHPVLVTSQNTCHHSLSSYVSRTTPQIS